MKRSPMPPGDPAKALSRHRRLAPSAASSAPLRARSGIGRGKRPAPGRHRQSRAEAAFSRKTRLSVRTRAGDGDPRAARCEADGVFLGPHAGDYQHIVARGMGGSRNPLLGSAANCALLCRACHDRCEARDREMGARGFWLPQGTDPRLMPMTLFGGVEVWRSETEARYLYEPPAVAA